jgi:hypothetical protein
MVVAGPEDICLIKGPFKTGFTIQDGQETGSIITNKGHVAVLTQKLPKVRVLPELEISIYRSLEARERVTD